MTVNKPTISQIAEVLRLRGIMQTISQISFSFAMLNKNYPFETINQDQADELIQEYKKLIERALTVIEAENYGKSRMD